MISCNFVVYVYMRVCVCLSVKTCGEQVYHCVCVKLCCCVCKRMRLCVYTSECVSLCIDVSLCVNVCICNTLRHCAVYWHLSAGV